MDYMRHHFLSNDYTPKQGWRHQLTTGILILLLPPSRPTSLPPACFRRLNALFYSFCERFTGYAQSTTQLLAVDTTLQSYIWWQYRSIFENSQEFQFEPPTTETYKFNHLLWAAYGPSHSWKYCGTDRPGPRYGLSSQAVRSRQTSNSWNISLFSTEISSSSQLVSPSSAIVRDANKNLNSEVFSNIHLQ